MLRRCWFTVWCWFPGVIRSSFDLKLISLVVRNASGQKQCLGHYLPPNQPLVMVTVDLVFFIKHFFLFVLSKLCSQCGA